MSSLYLHHLFPPCLSPFQHLLSVPSDFLNLLFCIYWAKHSIAHVYMCLGLTPWDCLTHWGLISVRSWFSRDQQPGVLDFLHPYQPLVFSIILLLVYCFSIVKCYHVLGFDLHFPEADGVKHLFMHLLAAFVCCVSWLSIALANSRTTNLEKVYFGSWLLNILVHNWVDHWELSGRAG